MRHSYYVFCIASLLSIAACGSARPSNDRSQLGASLMALWELDKLFDAYQKECSSPTTRIYDPTTVFATDPASFGGLTPQSAYWPEVQSAYKKYEERMCQYASREDFASIYSDELTRDLSTAELHDAINFYASPLGKKLISGNARANDVFQREASQRMAKLYRSAYAATASDLAEIVRKYKANPR